MSKYKVTISKTSVHNATVEVDPDADKPAEMEQAEWDALTLDEKLEWAAADKAEAQGAFWEKDTQYFTLLVEPLTPEGDETLDKIEQDDVDNNLDGRDPFFNDT